MSRNFKQNKQQKVNYCFFLTFLFVLIRKICFTVQSWVFSLGSLLFGWDSVTMLRPLHLNIQIRRMQRPSQILKFFHNVQCWTVVLAPIDMSAQIVSRNYAKYMICKNYFVSFLFFFKFFVTLDSVIFHLIEDQLQSTSEYYARKVVKSKHN